MRIEGRLSNSPDLTEDSKHLLILPSRSALTRLVVLQYYENNFHVGVQHSLLSTRNRLWFVNGQASVKHCINQCGKCVLDKAKPIWQLMTNLNVSKTSANHRAFEICGLDYFGPVSYVVGRSTRKAWGLLFTCIASRAIHVEIVTSLTLKDFLLAFSRFNDVCGKVEVIHWDNGTTFQAAAKTLPKLLHTTEFRNAFR